MLNAVEKELEKVPYTGSVASDARGAAIVAVVPGKFLETGGGANRKMLDSNIDAVKNKFAESNPCSAVYIHPSAEVTDKMFVYVLLTGLAAPLDEMNALCDEVSELIAKDKEIVKKNRKALKGLQ